MRQYLTNNTDLMMDMLRAFDSQGGLFVTKATQMESQSDVFRQLSFLIFSTHTDRIQDAQLDPLLKKMADSFKTQHKEKSFTIALFLLTRILILRLGPRKLAPALKRLWPHLVAELVSVFEQPLNDANKSSNSADSGGQNPIQMIQKILTQDNSTAIGGSADFRLVKEAIKVVELTSQLNIEDF